jgi:hypothetical protein
MARLRREAEEAKERERRAAEEHREKFKGKSAISSSDFFGVSCRIKAGCCLPHKCGGRRGLRSTVCSWHRDLRDTLHVDFLLNWISTGGLISVWRRKEK